MSAADVLQGLLIASVALGSLLILVAMAMTGRKLADLEYQRAHGINGINRIQVWTSIRTHVMRVCVGMTFVVIGSLLLGNAPEPWRMWVNRLLFALLPGSYVACSIMDWRAEQTQMYLLIQGDAAGLDLHEPRDIEDAPHG